MKTRDAFLGCVAGVFLAIVPAAASESKLPGDVLTAQQAREKADTVFLGKLVSLEPLKEKAKGEYVAKVIYVSRAANGITPARSTQNTTVRTSGIATDLSVPVTMIVGANEVAPEVGRTYVIYARDNKRPGGVGYEAVKLVSTAEHGLPSRAF